ncbi:MAG TPA: IS4 family transposase [Gemmataceae bacterium]|nr:IS4 family transposase [Gemmataceae bacterium]
MHAWIANETQTADFGDERLDRRFAVVLESLSEKPSLSIPAACGGLAETTAAYRFFANERVDAAKVLQPHRDATVERVREQKVVLVAQDTTEADLTRAVEKVGGPLNDEARWGLFAHTQLVLTPERVPLGVLRAEIWSRDPEEFAKTQQEKRRERKNKPIEEKESYRWLQGYRHACQLAEQAPDTTVVSLSDSEGDIYECFAEASAGADKRAEWIVRACQDRALAEGTGSLIQQLMCTRSLGTLRIDVSKRDAATGDQRKRKQARPARKAKVTVRATSVLLRPPARAGTKLLPVRVNAILVREEKPPAASEPLEWLLLTSLPIETFADVCQVIEYYCCRWEIEIYFRVLKSGCNIEELQLETEARVQACLAVYMIVAWRVLFLLMMGRQCPKLSCDAVLSEAEWKSVYTMVANKPAPIQPPLLQGMVAMIAELGGYLGRKHDGPPGPQTMWIGIQRMRDFAAAWSAFGPGRRVTRDV